MVPSVVFLQSTLCSKSTFWVIPFTCCGSQCCLAPKCFLLKNEHFGWFPSFFMVSSVVWFKYIFHSKSTFFGWFPSLFMVPSVVWFQCVFRSKPIFFSLFMVLCVVSFPVLFGSNMFSTQNQHFGWFPSLFMVPSVVWLQIALCSPC